jgi:hypothetical protein
MNDRRSSINNSSINNSSINNSSINNSSGYNNSIFEKTNKKQWAQQHNSDNQHVSICEHSVRIVAAKRENLPARALGSPRLHLQPQSCVEALLHDEQSIEQWR